MLCGELKPHRQRKCEAYEKKGKQYGKTEKLQTCSKILCFSMRQQSHDHGKLPMLLTVSGHCPGLLGSDVDWISYHLSDESVLCGMSTEAQAPAQWGDHTPAMQTEFLARYSTESLNTVYNWKEASSGNDQGKNSHISCFTFIYLV